MLEHFEDMEEFREPVVMNFNLILIRSQICSMTLIFNFRSRRGFGKKNRNSFASILVGFSSWTLSWERALG